MDVRDNCSKVFKQFHDGVQVCKTLSPVVKLQKWTSVSVDHVKNVQLPSFPKLPELPKRPNLPKLPEIDDKHKRRIIIAVLCILTTAVVIFYASLLIKQEVEIADLKKEVLQFEHLIVQIKRMEEIKADLDQVEEIENDLKQIAELEKETKTIQTSLNYADSRISLNENRINQIKLDGQSMKYDIGNVRNKWPRGGYCLVYNDRSCPWGFYYTSPSGIWAYCCKYS
ncbi:uncharacterized protein LOC142351228 [Convolutriloba macropyga]|uniref:uncharacterized protein LOC142351228 n=1 Tax=Convolutriloba macropyga TaxID=536237 RepID=UPI003F522958